MKTIRSLSQSVLAVGLLVLLLANTVFGQQSVIHGRVVGVTDGDTLKILVAGQELLRVRIAFCDAPEKRQAFGTRAKQAMSELAFGKEIELRRHAIDRYGRTVAQVFVDGKDVGLEMLRQGFAWVYDRYITDASTEVQETYRKAQEEAKAERRGLWSDPNSIPPWIFRDLAKAHQEQTIASNWIEAHQKQIVPNTPSPQRAPPSPSESLMILTRFGSTPKAGSSGSRDRDIVVKRDEASICPKKRLCRRFLSANSTGELLWP